VTYIVHYVLEERTILHKAVSNGGALVFRETACQLVDLATMAGCLELDWTGQAGLTAAARQRRSYHTSS